MPPELSTSIVLRALVPFLCFAVTGTALIAHVPSIRDELTGFADRWVLGTIAGAAVNAILLLLFAAAGGTIGPWPPIALAAVSVAAAFLRFGVRWVGVVNLEQAVTAVLLPILLVVGVDHRMCCIRRFAGHLLDGDPLRHHVFTRFIYETGTVSPWAPLMETHQPELSFQLHYILAAVIAHLGGFDPFDMWREGALVAGALGGVFGGYLLGRLVFEDAVVGWFAAALLVSTPVHAMRTSIGFAEPWSLAFYATALAFYLRFLVHHRTSDAALFGLTFTAAAGSNAPNGAFLLPYLLGTFAVVCAADFKRVRLHFLGAYFTTRSRGVAGTWT
jgi:hypothetical protein